MIIKKILITLCLFACALGIIAYKSMTQYEEVSEPVIIPVSETTSEDIIEIVPEVETEPIIETAPEDDYISYDVPFDVETQKEIIKICEEFNLSYETVLGIIFVESSFRPTVMGDNGNSYGLMQIQPKWCKAIMEREGITDLLEPLQNVRCGCAIMRDLINRYGTERRALQAYNTGRPDTTNGYADKVYKYANGLKEATK